MPNEVFSKLPMLCFPNEYIKRKKKLETGDIHSIDDGRFQIACLQDFCQPRNYVIDVALNSDLSILFLNLHFPIVSPDRSPEINKIILC